MKQNESFKFNEQKLNIDCIYAEPFLCISDLIKVLEQENTHAFCEYLKSQQENFNLLTENGTTDYLPLLEYKDLEDNQSNSEMLCYLIEESFFSFTKHLYNHDCEDSKLVNTLFNLLKTVRDFTQKHRKYRKELYASCLSVMYRQYLDYKNILEQNEKLKAEIELLKKKIHD